MGKIILYTQAYNSEKYIRKCIESVLNQTYTNFSYYLIDNGSTDNTWKIIKEYAQNDSRIIPIHLEKNTFFLLEKYLYLAYKKGKELFAILDSDDWYENTFLEKMIGVLIETNADLVSCASKIVFENGQPSQIKRPSDNILIIEKEHFSSTFPYLYTHYGALWGRIYKTSIIAENNILLNRTVKYGRDTEFVLNYQKHCKRIVFYPEPLHNYYIRKSSVSSSFDENALDSNENFYKSLYKYLENISGLNNLNLIFISCIYLSLLTNTGVNPLITDEISYEKKLNIMYNTFNSKITRECWPRLNNISPELKKKWGLDKELLKYKQILLTYIFKTYRKKDNIKFYEMICFLIPMFREMCDENDVEFWVNNNHDLLYSFIGLNRNELFSRLIILFKNRKNSNHIWKAISKLLEKNILLSWINDKKFLTKYSDIINLIYHNNLSTALEKILMELNNKKNEKFREEMLFMCLNVSAMLEKGEIFICAKKLQTEFFIEKKRFEEAKLALDDLLDMCPEDDDVLRLKTWLEAENG